MAFAPKREIKSQRIKNALKRIFVPAVIEHYPVIAVRALWERETIEDMHVAKTLIALIPNLSSFREIPWS